MTPTAAEEHDVIVVGSGFGGSFVAHALAKDGHKVCVLERGGRWQPGDFPRRPDELFANVWDPISMRYGLFDIQSFKGLTVLVAAGVGGGSLIYANVLLEKPNRWFTTPAGDCESVEWPISGDDLREEYARAKGLLEPMQFVASPVTAPRTAAFERAARNCGYRVTAPDLAVNFANGRGGRADGKEIRAVEGIHREPCRLCGECILGCNFGSKNTLDLMLLRDDHITVRERTLVRSVAPIHAGRYHFEVRYIDLHGRDRSPLREQREELSIMRCNVLILAAGSLGSTELMLRSAVGFPGLSRHVGTRFSPNGDLLTFGSRLGRRRRGRQYIARGADMSIGPTITRTAVVGEKRADSGRFHVQDAGLPGQLAWLIFGLRTRSLLYRAGRGVGNRALDLVGRDPRTRVGDRVTTSVPRSRVSRSFAVLGMGVDTADGRMKLHQDQLQLSWTVRRSRALLRQIEGASDDLIQELGGRTWPTTLTSLGQIITVHPVGGLPMGMSAATGVVDDHGEVFGWPGLFVTDGAALPGAVGPNPGLTIAAFALRAAEKVMERLGEKDMGSG